MRKGADSKIIGYMCNYCACDKSQREKRTIVYTTIASSDPFNPITTKETKYFCKKCNYEILPKDDSKNNPKER